MLAKGVDSHNRTVSYMLHKCNEAVIYFPHSFKRECFLQYPVIFRKSSGPHVNATAQGGILKL
jgi:hypothetical protein